MDSVLVNIDDLKMDSPDLHSVSFNQEPLSKMQMEGELEGDIITQSNRNSGAVEGELNTLDEPILDTVKRDLKAVGNKIHNALLPMKDPKFLLVEWDLWGALFFATYIGIVLQQMNSYNLYASQFTQIILMACLGIAGVTYSHVVMLRTNTSIYQYVSVLGYCLAPMTISVTISYLLDFLLGRPFWIRFILFAVSFGWSVYAASLILKPDDGPLNIPYHLAPIGLYYFVIAVLILYHTGSPPGVSAAPVPPPQAALSPTPGT